MNTFNCLICEKKFIGNMNNSDPFIGGRCCDVCNEKFIIPLRVHEATENKKTAILFKTDGTISYIKPIDNYFTISELQLLVGGNIELYPQKIGGCLIVCNEEGLLINLPKNKLFKIYSAIALVGNILLCPEMIFERPEM